ncbi:J domain-containing protein [Methylococcus geothermalis]|uniref:Molecular chaperone DnaJ n=1 Tax=Methylococcus geothermalis TaxID=2681310 RepID=A0A858Q9J4_9GAMM|nr:molecular chaperone DnaJ [Methylococcus geothermalis]QJD30520.1 molecular chaperone DnaJ [Methylococcus geothermalis]
MIQIVLLLLILLLVLPALGALLRALGPALAGGFRRMAPWLILLLFVGLAATGRLGWVLPLAGAVFAVLLRLLPALLPLLPVLQRLWRRKTFDAAEASVVETPFLRMRLDRTTGEIRGEILAGRQAGRQLYDLSPAELRQLHAELTRADAESARLLGAYLDRVMGAGWRAGTGAGADDAGTGSFASGKMSRSEALAILGLKEGAQRDAVVEAHRRLMQKLHPDRGGSDYLAAKINQAKDVLLRENR